MKTCSQCRRQLPDTVQACPGCGIVLDESVIGRAGAPAAGRVSTVVETPFPGSGAGRATMDLRPTPPSAPPPSAVPSPQPSPARADRPPGRRGQTVYMPAPPPDQLTGQGEPGRPSAAAARKVVAVLVTYSWKPAGEVFPVREGRNLIGRGEECDIPIAADPMLSQINTHITFRQNFVVGDMVSMSGTDLNGEPVEEQFRPLENHARIRTGSTHWHFVIVDPEILARKTEPVVSDADA